MYPLIDIFGFHIPTYGLTFFVGFVIAIIVGRKISYKYTVNKDDFLYAAIYAAIGILIGSKILFFISKLPKIIPNFDTFLEMIKNDPLLALEYCFGGFVFYGGLIGAIAGIYIYCRQYKRAFMPIIGLAAPLIPFIHGFGRMACFFAGCCYGIEYHGPFAIQFPENELVPELNEVPRFPVQLLEASLNFIMFGILIFIAFQMLKKAQNIILVSSRLIGIYLIYYTIARYFLEMLRGDAIRGAVGGISTSQIISIILLPIGIYLIIGNWTKKKETI